jgi:hypothetical protein
VGGVTGETFIDKAVFRDFGSDMDIVDLNMFAKVTSDGTDKVSIACEDVNFGDPSWENARLLEMKVA